MLTLWSTDHQLAFQARVDLISIAAKIEVEVGIGTSHFYTIFVIQLRCWAFARAGCIIREITVQHVGLLLLTIQASCLDNW